MRGTTAIVSYAEVVLYVMGGQNIIYHFKHVEIVVNYVVSAASLISMKVDLGNNYVHEVEIF